MQRSAGILNLLNLQYIYMQTYQQKIFTISHFKLALALSLLFASFVALGGAAYVFAQSSFPGEICNGKDDNHNGVVDDGVNCQHYLSYLVDKTIQPISVVVRDQFIEPTDIELTGIERILNPVKKLHENLAFGIRRPDLHYLAYRFKMPTRFTPQSVFIANQFEQRNIVVTQPRYLLAPTGKKKAGTPIEKVLSTVPQFVSEKIIASIIPPVPKDADHYLCYDVEPYEVSEAVALRDQFQSKEFKTLRAKYLCNPAEKRHGETTYKILDENNHLMCYEVVPHNPAYRKVITHDQFGIKSLAVIRTEEVCLPTVKVASQCLSPDERGTAVVFDRHKVYQSTKDKFMIIEPTPTSNGLTASGTLQSTLDTVIMRSGSPTEGETYLFDTEMLALQLSSGRTLSIPMNGRINTNPRTPGEPVQSFDTDMFQLQGQLPPGDPDFDLLRFTAGTGYGLPSPGHTTLTQQPGGSWNVDSFFDITYRIDFVGKPGGHYEARSGSTTGTIRMEDPCEDDEQSLQD